jgi:hypothetical protein
MSWRSPRRSEAVGGSDTPLRGKTNLPARRLTLNESLDVLRRRRRRCEHSPSGRIRTNLRVDRQGPSAAESCRGSGRRMVAGGHALAARTCSQVRPPEPSPQEPCRDSRHEEMPKQGRLVRKHTVNRWNPTLAKRIKLHAPPRAGCRGTILGTSLPGVGAASMLELRARDPRLPSYCRCRGNALRFSRTLKLVHMPTGRGQGEGSDVTSTLAVIGTEASYSARSNK